MSTSADIQSIMSDAQGFAKDAFTSAQAQLQAAQVAASAFVTILADTSNLPNPPEIPEASEEEVVP